MRRLGVFVLIATVVAAVIASSAQAALFFLFKPTAAKPGELISVRLGGTPASFTLARREKPFQQAIRVYLVPDRIAREITSRFDPRLHFVGRLVPDRNTHGILTFTVPPLDTGTYAAAAWCPGCARYSSGRTFFVMPVPKVSRYRNLMGLRVADAVCDGELPCHTRHRSRGKVRQRPALDEGSLQRRPHRAEGA